MKQKSFIPSQKKELLFKSSTLIALSLFTVTGVAKADEITVTGNGSASTNEISAASSQTTNVQQTNTATVDNNVQTSSNTGNNSASSNTNGNAAVQSGDTATTVAVANTANTNTVTTGACCQTTGNNNATVTGNGSDSTNTLSVSNTTTNTIQTTNTATITNHVSGSANTGNNYANNNSGGNVSIKTGSINVSENLKSGPVNINAITVSTNASNGFSVKIAGNGAGSVNTVAINQNTETNVETDNAVHILNESLWLLNTGNNSASNNAGGNVTISTGGINFFADIVNGPINSNSVDVNCHCENKPTKPEKPETPPTSNQPGTPAQSTSTGSSSSSNSSSSNGVGGAVLAAAVGKILPATGNYAFLFLLLGNSLLFLLGVTLRLRSGRSPGLLVIPSL